jgi:murein L,D-transpeptidase YcbB/YkuD
MADRDWFGLPVRPSVTRLLPIIAVMLTVAAQGGTVTPSTAASVRHRAADDSVATMLRDAARAGTLSGLRWPRFPYYRDELTGLYSGTSWQPVWSKGGRPTPAARSAIEVLATASERGLHPDDYDAALLNRRLRELASATAPSARDIGWFDAALSVGVLRHVSDVRIGRVNPKTLSVGINVAPKKLDLARVLRDAIDRGRVAEMVRDAEPTFVQYRNLKVAYARYRVLAADSTIPTVAAARVVRRGDAFAGVGALRRRLVALGDLSPEAGATADTTYDSVIAAGVAKFQARHGLPPDSVLGRATLAAVNVPLAKRVRQLELALERIRWLPALDAGPFVVVNVPGFQLYAFDTLGVDGMPSLTMNVVVGKAELGRQTPLFERDMQYIIFRPYWVIPPGILREEILPAVRRDPGYLASHDMEIYRGSGDTGPALPATSANLARVSRGELGIRRRPGPRNDLGLAKFIFPNDHNVYMHGTPATALFSRARRDFSHGCIRLEDPARFAVWTLRDPNEWSPDRVRSAMNGTRSERVDLARPVPVTVLYTTAVVSPEGMVSFYDDVYGHDARLERVLAKGYPFPP